MQVINKARIKQAGEKRTRDARPYRVRLSVVQVDAPPGAMMKNILEFFESFTDRFPAIRSCIKIKLNVFDCIVNFPAFIGGELALVIWMVNQYVQIIVTSRIPDRQIFFCERADVFSVTKTVATSTTKDFSAFWSVRMIYKRFDECTVTAIGAVEIILIGKACGKCIKTHI